MIWTAFTIGLVGSLHCVGMCGPIAMALPFKDHKPAGTAANVLLYNAGRIATYALLGSIVGLLGRGLFLAGLQTYVSIGLGVLLLLIALFSINVEARLQTIPALAGLNEWVKQQLAAMLRSPQRRSLFLVGMLNGLLPCGLVYVGIAGAVASGGIFSGMAYMGLFGLGTLPLMLAAALAGQWISLRLRSRLRRALPVFLVAFAILFIARGLHFQIPDTFRFWENIQQIPMCH